MDISPDRVSTTRPNKVIDRHLLVVALVGIVAIVFMLAYLYASPHNSPGPSGDKGSTKVSGPPVADCIARCRAMLSAGARFSGDLCVVADIRGYGCSVSVDGRSACSTAGSTPQILLTPECTVLKVVK